MDEEMLEAAEEGVSVCFEVDLDYEFDAPRYFDLNREETPAEARVAELWFETAGSYPPSPMTAKLSFRKDVQVANTNSIWDLKDLEYTNPDGAHTDAAAPEFSVVCHINRGCTFRSSMLQSVSKVENKSTAKSPFSKRSTLMKPTASQLAKQNRPHKVKSISRFQKQLEIEKEQSFGDSNDYCHQPAKRQRLDKGHCCKIAGGKQQINFFHKVSENKIGLADANNQLPRLKLTILREPELDTARRALNLKAQKPRSDDAKYFAEGMSQTTSTQKRCILNRKILEAPSPPLPSSTRLLKFKEFNFRNHDRALQHRATKSSLSPGNHIPSAIGDVKYSLLAKCQSSGHQPLQNVGERNAEDKDLPKKFKSQPLNKKILTSKGDIGVFQSTKREITVPKEFNLSTAKRFQQPPLNELFSKLSLTSGAQEASAIPKFTLPSHLDIEEESYNQGLNLALERSRYVITFKYGVNTGGVIGFFSS